MLTRRIKLDNPVYGGNLIGVFSNKSSVMQAYVLTSRPRAATSVQIRVPDVALTNSKNAKSRLLACDTDSGHNDEDPTVCSLGLLLFAMKIQNLQIDEV